MCIPVRSNHGQELVFLDAQDTLVVVVGSLAGGGVEVTSLHDDQDAVIAAEQA